MDEQLMDEIEVPIEEVKEDEPLIIHEGEESFSKSLEPEASDDIEEVEEKSDKVKKKISVKTRINQYTRKYHEELRRAEKAERDLALMQEEHERLKRSFETSNKAVMNSQEGMLDALIQKAKQLKQKAIEDGDVQAQIDADVSLAEAVSDKRALDSVKVSQKIYEEERARMPAQQNVQRQPMAQEPEAYATPETEEWLQENSWFDENSDDFDPDLHEKALRYAQSLDTRYNRRGMSNKVLSQEYFDEIDRYMQKHMTKNTLNQNSNQGRGELSMNRPRGSVSGVNRAHVPGQRETFRMSKDEQEMARAMGWTDQQWYKYKKQAEINEAKGILKSAMGNSR